MEKRLLTIKEVATLMNFPTGKVYQLVKSHGFPSLKIGKEWRIDSSKLDRWINQQIQIKDSECLTNYNYY